jgi:hypothetical protein
LCRGRWRGLGRLFPPGQSGDPAGRRRGSRNKAALAAATLLDGETLGLTPRAVEAALAGDKLAMKLCLERVPPRCQERPVTFSLPSFAAGNGKIDEPSPQNVSRAMNAVTTPLACGEITPGEVAAIAEVYETFLRTAGIAGEKVARGNRLRILTAGDDLEDEDEDIDDAAAIDDCDPLNGGGRRLPDRRVLIQPGGKILLQIFCRCRKRNRGMQLMVWFEKRRADGQRRSGNRPTVEEGPFGDGPAMRRTLTCASASPARRCRWPAATAPREPPAGRPPRPQGSAPDPK